MAAEKWITKGKRECEFIRREVELREQRVYPTSDFLLDCNNTFRVRVCLCTAAIDCNLAGISCKWAMNAPDTDRF